MIRVKDGLSSGSQAELGYIYTTFYESPSWLLEGKLMILNGSVQERPSRTNDAINVIIPLIRASYGSNQSTVITRPRMSTAMRRNPPESKIEKFLTRPRMIRCKSCQFEVVIVLNHRASLFVAAANNKSEATSWRGNKIRRESWCCSYQPGRHNRRKNFRRANLKAKMHPKLSEARSSRLRSKQTAKRHSKHRRPRRTETWDDQPGLHRRRTRTLGLVRATARGKASDNFRLPGSHGRCIQELFPQE